MGPSNNGRRGNGTTGTFRQLPLQPPDRPEAAGVPPPPASLSPRHGAGPEEPPLTPSARTTTAVRAGGRPVARPQHPRRPGPLPRGLPWSRGAARPVRSAPLPSGGSSAPANGPARAGARTHRLPAFHVASASRRACAQGGSGLVMGCCAAGHAGKCSPARGGPVSAAGTSGWYGGAERPGSPAHGLLFGTRGLPCPAARPFCH